MPILLGFLACERVIYEQTTNSASIISILHDVFIPVIKTIPIPLNTSAPLSWIAFAMWYQVPAEAGMWFEQMVVLTGEQQEPLIQSDPIRFQQHKPVMRTESHFANFPVYRPAKCWLRLYIRNLGLLPPPPSHPSTAQLEEVMAYPIALHHTYYPS